VSHDDFAFEPIRGLPQALPPGERLLWQGSPHADSLARRAFHARKIAVYFALLALWDLGTSLSADAPWTTIALGLTLYALGACATLGILGWLASRIARTTVYSITTRRVVMRFGIALPMTINLPYRAVEAAALKVQADGTGDISLSLLPANRLAYLVLWPHVRAWRFTRTQPTLREVPDAARAAEILSRALAADIGGAALAPERADTAVCVRTPDHAPAPT
jgi:hypothetical protein